ncbi:hypothetical protein H7U19_10215 [Hyunsoonleella sp. SJ7]|uniref:Uncharacterized protein n=1 Tax=Hyunsoonleella aquatilis TaxID=2762758 RepID=A0A923H999_9FLAO|nr:DUF6452 family protein [Hyunsoonleella aquatilis]MBC3758778.1 hypothetical protein [Hyunsoonleella aquatilis]
MKKISVLVLMLFIVGNYSCERDDLCPDSTATTPKLIIESFDISDQEESKNIFDLRIVGQGKDNPLSIFLPGTENEVTYDGTGNVSTIYLPLRTDENETVYTFIQEYAVDDDGNQIEGETDTVTIRYETEEVYVSRACGYKTIFKNVTVTPGDGWVTQIQAINANQSVEDENETHFKLLF